jgi:hypothetical protein
MTVHNMLYLFHFGGHIRGHIIKTIIAVTERTTIKLLLLTAIFVGWFMVFNATFNNISVILWRFIAFVKIKSFYEDLFFLLVIKSIYNL